MTGKLNTLLKEIARVKRELMLVQAGAAEKIEAIRAEAGAVAGPLQSDLAILEDQLETLVTSQKDALLGDSKSRKYGLGTVGFRVSKSIELAGKRTIESVLNSLKKGGHTQCIKTVETLNRGAMAGWTDAELAKVGLKRVKKDTFWYNLTEGVRS